MAAMVSSQSTPPCLSEHTGATGATVVAGAGSTPAVHVLCCPVCRFTALSLSPLLAHWIDSHPGVAPQTLHIYGCTECSSTATENNVMQQHCQLFHDSDKKARVKLLREERLPYVGTSPSPSKKERGLVEEDVNSKSAPSTPVTPGTPTRPVVTSGAVGSKKRKQNNPGRCKISPSITSSKPQLHQRPLSIEAVAAAAAAAARSRVAAVRVTVTSEDGQQAEDLSVSGCRNKLTAQHGNSKTQDESTEDAGYMLQMDVSTDDDQALDMRINKSKMPRHSSGHSSHNQSGSSSCESGEPSASMTLADLALRCQTLRPLFQPLHDSPLVDVLTHLGSDSPPLSGGSGGTSGGNNGLNSSRSRPQRQNFSPAQNKVLMEWYMEHRDKPYPSTDETKELARRSGLQYSQVKKWFANKRARTQLCQRRLKSDRGHGQNGRGHGHSSPASFQSSPNNFPLGPMPFLSVKTSEGYFFPNANNGVPLLTVGMGEHGDSGATSPVSP